MNVTNTLNVVMLSAFVLGVIGAASQVLLLAMVPIISIPVVLYFLYKLDYRNFGANGTLISRIFGALVLWIYLGGLASISKPLVFVFVIAEFLIILDRRGKIRLPFVKH